MKKHLVLILILGFVCTILVAQVTPTQQTPRQTTTPGFQGVRQYVEQQEILIEVKSQIPDTALFQDKSDTYQEAGVYNFSFDIRDIHENSEILLNKWLKESK